MTDSDIINWMEQTKSQVSWNATEGWAILLRIRNPQGKVLPAIQSSANHLRDLIENAKVKLDEANARPAWENEKLGE